MTLKSLSILLLILSLLVPFVLSHISIAVSRQKPAVVGRWLPIKNLKAPKVQKVAQFAVTEHNKQANANLKFRSVLRGETQVISGTNYRLVIAAIDGTVSGNYEAIVWVKPWQRYRNLTSFKSL